MFSSWLIKSRRALGLTQRELGRLAGASGSAVGMWERGRRLPGPRSAARLRAFFAARGIKMPPLPRQTELPERERFFTEIKKLLRK